jgi:transcription initiation factor TFIIE subunit alpha
LSKPVNERISILAELARSIVGDIGERIVNIIGEKGAIKDDELSLILGMGENEVRKILWKLADYTIVTTKKEVNSETGWITYYWQLSLDTAFGVLYNIYKRVLDRLENKLEYERANVFFWCNSAGCPRYTFDKATEMMFRCDKCGKSLKPYDNSHLIAAITWTISEIKKAMNELIETDSASNNEEHS